ncbi:4673_t:CDS:2 [Funneliformis mosseae]|uniref:4673_t:CDS:1 n=1 Tax=Funneliformis mosseae TaxID=27381 RepID=A0A9N9F2Z8_FUNMO|nr:4673_t:CDS:2 [Funneliformis mosseae]
MSQPGIFSKSYLIYILLSVTTAHTLNFICNSPISTWQEFPPKLPTSVYSSIFFNALLLFLSLSFEPIQSSKQFYILLSQCPRDFWSARWQLMISESFKELGFLSVKNVFASFVPKKIANMMGVLGAFGVSVYCINTLSLVNLIFGQVNTSFSL